MKTKIISLLVLIAFAVVSCQKDETDKPVVKQDVEFGIIQVDPNMLKNDWDFECDFDLVATVAHIEIEFEDETTQTFTPQIFFLNGNLYTQAIQLPTGTYTITKFLLLTEEGVNGQIVMATPEAGATYAGYVSKPVEFDITVGEFTKVEVEVEVLCFTPNVANDFGFFWFVIDEIIVREQCFFGDLCIKDKSDYIGSMYSTLFGADLSGYPFDLPAIFKVVVTRTNADAPWTKTFSNVGEDDLGNPVFIAPLCVKYPDRVGFTDNYKFELYVLVAQGDGWEYVLFNEVTFVDAYIDELNANGEVIDFVIGNCNYDPTGWVFPAHMNLPEKAAVNIAHPGNPGYWNLNFTSFTPGGSYDIPLGLMTGWCGDANTGITGGNKTMYIYNSLDPASWPVNMPAVFSVAKINQVNWLFNNLGNYGYDIASIDPLYIVAGELTVAEGNTIQNAIWSIINGAGTFTPLTGSESLAFSTDMAGDAAPYGAYSPLPGGWAAILMVPEVNGVPDAIQAQLIFTVVDP